MTSGEMDRSPETPAPRWLIVVGRNTPHVYEHLRHGFEPDELVDVILDRRHGDRRKESQPVTLDRRRRQRRQPLPLSLWAVAPTRPSVWLRGPRAGDPPLEGRPRVASADASAGSGRDRLLVCENDRSIVEPIAEALIAESFAVETAERAVDAIRQIMRMRYQALVLGLKLPGLAGLDALAIIKRLDADLPIIAMSEYVSYETERAVRAAGVFYYLVKPFPLQELTDAVRAAVRPWEGVTACG